MKVLWNMNQISFAAIGGFIGWFWGGADGLFYALITFVVVDYITGLMCAIAKRELSSEIGFMGIFRKVLIFMLVGVAHILDALVIGTGSVLRTAVICFYLSNEGLSIVENAADLGLPIPAQLKRVLKQIKSDSSNPKPRTTTKKKTSKPAAKKTTTTRRKTNDSKNDN